MKKRYKVYLPGWMRKFILAILGIVWLGITVAGLFLEAPDDRIPLPVWAMLTVVLAAVGIMMWMTSSGRLHVYEIEAEDDEPEGRKK